MSTLKEQCQQAQEAQAALQSAKAAVTASYAQMWLTLAPVIERHEREIGELFKAAGYSQEYEERFGDSYGRFLVNFSVGEEYLELVLGYTCRGESCYNDFRLPLRYLQADPEAQLDLDVAHYQRVLARLARMQEAGKKRATREENLREFARLKALLKDEPEACA